MRRFTSREKRDGEMAVREMSRKAQEIYNGCDPFAVYEYEEAGKKLYAYDGCLGSSNLMSFEEMEAALEALADELGEEE